MFGGNFAPVGWAFCNGALIPISENDTLFNLIGTTYGGAAGLSSSETNAINGGALNFRVLMDPTKYVWDPLTPGAQ